MKQLLAAVFAMFAVGAFAAEADTIHIQVASGTNIAVGHDIATSDIARCRCCTGNILTSGGPDHYVGGTTNADLSVTTGIQQHGGSTVLN